MNKPKYYTVEQAKQAGFTLDPIICVHCKHIGEVTYDQVVNDYYCAACGYWHEEDVKQVQALIDGLTYFTDPSVYYLNGFTTPRMDDLVRYAENVLKDIPGRIDGSVGEAQNLK